MAMVRTKVEHPYLEPQTPVWLCKSSLSLPGQEYGATDHAVCAVEYVDVSPELLTSAGEVRL